MSLDSAAMNAPPVRVVDVLSGLLDAERNNIIRFMGEGSPYLSRATAEIRRPLQEMVDANARHVRELGELIISLGGNPPPFAPVQSEEQYLAFLSLQFLLPKLVHTRELTITRYETALAALEDAPPEVTDLLRSHLAEHREQLQILEKAAADVIAKAR
jgi:hypothetical protein